MKFFKIILGATLGGLVLYGVGAEVAAAPPKAKVPPGAVLVSFKELAGPAMPESATEAKQGDYLKRVPARIMGLNGQRVVIQGFMIPTQNEATLVRSFLLVRNQASCCFGLPPQVSDVLVVQMAAKPAERMMDQVVNVTGTLHVAERWAGPYLSSLYQMDAEDVAPNSARLPMPLNRTPQAVGLE